MWQRGVHALTATLLACAVAGCSASPVEETAGLPDDATVTYAFHDSSVPPQYHRSVTLTVTRDEAHIVVDSYGDVLADETLPTPPEVWQALVATLPTVAGLEVEEPDEGCAGGTGIELTVSTPGELLVDLSPESCAGSNDSVEQSIDGWLAPARDLFPATDVLAPEQS